MKTISKLLITTASASLLLGACSTSDATEAPAKMEMASSTPSSVMDTVLAGSWRTEQSARDASRHPAETLAFFGLEAGQNVVEIAPGGSGWYTGVIAPYVKATGGTFTAVAVSDNFKEKFVNTETYGTVNTGDFGKDSAPFATGSADLVLTFRSVHGWVGREYEAKAFGDFFTALKPGGVLGVVEHRLPESVEENMRGGYVKASYVKELAAAAGFEFVGSSEVNANAKDMTDHPFGVWTLPPTSRTSAFGQPADDSFDTAKYKAIGESDRYTLKFRKPG